MRRDAVLCYALRCYEMLRDLNAMLGVGASEVATTSADSLGRLMICVGVR